MGKELRNRKLVGWKIWYMDGTVLSSKNNKWIDCKQGEIEVVKMFYSSDSGLETNLHHGQEYYILDDLLQLPIEIKIGKGMEGEEFWEMYEQAKNETEIITEMRE